MSITEIIPQSFGWRRQKWVKIGQNGREKVKYNTQTYKNGPVGYTGIHLIHSKYIKTLEIEKPEPRI